MNFFEEMTNSLIANVDCTMRVCEVSFEKAIAQCKEESIAGPKVWEAVADHYREIDEQQRCASS